MVKVPPWRRPSSAPAPPQGGPGGPALPGEEASPLSAQSLPRVLERAATKTAHFPAFDHVGTAILDTGAELYRGMTKMTNCGGTPTPNYHSHPHQAHILALNPHPRPHPDSNPNP